MDFKQKATLFFNIYALFGFYVCLADHKKTIHVPIAKPTSMVKETGKLNTMYTEVCAQICSFWSCTSYYCPNGICCMPGNPESRCCPQSQPLCVLSDNACCPEGYPEVCGETCCTPDSVCCEDGNICCDKDETCCGDKCCGEGYVCCKKDGQDETSCCKDEGSCCGNKCCRGGSNCCTDRETKPVKSTCCNNEAMACCGDCGCNAPCISQFDAIPCDAKISDFQADTFGVDARRKPVECLNYRNTKRLYRILNKDESCEQRLVARDPINIEKRSILSHVNCGSRRKKNGQYCVNTRYISTSSTLNSNSMQKFLNMTSRSINPLVEIKYPEDFAGGQCIVSADLTKAGVRTRFLGKAVCKNFAKSSCEVLVRCKKGYRLGCTEIHASDHNINGRLDDEL